MIDLPCVVFAFNRPDKLRRVLDALRPQGIKRLVIFVDGPRKPEELAQVEACRELARKVDWSNTALHLWEENRGLGGLVDNISLVFETYPQAVFVEDDCLPSPGFYEFMRQALEVYSGAAKVFSIGAYQPLSLSYFENDRRAVVSGARFTCWGWGTWSDRWQALRPDIDHFADLYDGLEHVPEIAGADLQGMARAVAAKKIGESWAVKVAISSMHRRWVHLLATRGLVRNIGLDRSGIHGGLTNILSGWRLLNQNVVERLPDGLEWPEAVDLDCDYAADSAAFISLTHSYSARQIWQRGKALARRSLRLGYERLPDLDLLDKPHAPPEKKALVAYIVAPFSISREDQRFLYHNNNWYAQEMVRVLNHMGYRVDVVDYRDTAFEPEADYELFVGHGGINYAKIAKALPPGCLKVYFSSGAHWRFHNQEEQVRFQALQQRRGAALPFDRYISSPEEEALSLADVIIGLGNAFTRQTYADFDNVVMLKNAALLDDHFEWCSKDYQAGRMNFLYYAGKGCIHKGLDLLLEAFSGLEQHLWISSVVDAEFARVFANELDKTPNIHLVGWTRPRSKDFYRLMRKCNFCILPSASEGGAQSVVECMNQGLIPLVSEACGLDVGAYGRLIDPCTIDEIARLVRQVSSYPAEECRELSLAARRSVLRDFSEKSFSQQFESALRGFLDDRKIG